jgi:integrase
MRGSSRRAEADRHTFGSLTMNVASIVRIQAWMGHADIQTTMRYLHHKSRADDARPFSAVFRPKNRKTNPQALDANQEAGTQSRQARATA